ncbi:hypothetical protein [Streptomyces shenzhenensis]|uniref:hypothetical protein n=1 Tax=Streptomyces shenzhenensis TaxID=943815 RepID=UPI0015F01579|nr:hypothetical protein [Streptomyces shenzhenensis]
MRVTVVRPGSTRSELTYRGGPPEVHGVARAAAERPAIPASAVAGGIAFAAGHPANVDVDELIVCAVAQYWTSEMPISA